MSTPLFDAINQFDDAQWMRDYASDPRMRREQVDEMSEEDKDNWIKESMALFSRLLKEEAT